MNKTMLLTLMGVMACNGEETDTDWDTDTGTEAEVGTEADSDTESFVDVDLTSDLWLHLTFDGTLEDDQASATPSSSSSSQSTTMFGTGTDGGVDTALASEACAVYDSVAFPGGSAMTIAAWIQPSVTFGGVQSTTRQWAVAPYGPFQLMYIDDSSSGYWVFEMYSDSPGRSSHPVSFAANEPMGSWVHIAVSYDADEDTYAVYRNGVWEASGAPGENVQGGAFPLTVGCLFNNGNTTQFPGAIDDLRIYSRALTSDDIEALAASR